MPVFRGLAWLAALTAPVSLFAAAPTFKPDAAIQGSSLSGWHTLGTAQWSAKDGTVTGVSKGQDGWLVLDKSLQDVALYASFRCSGACKAGYLLRAEKTADGWKGIFVSLSPDDVGDYRVMLDSNGKITSREKLVRAGGQERFEGKPQPPSLPRPAAARPRYTSILPAPKNTVDPSGWNSAEVEIDMNTVRLFLNDAAENGGFAENAYGSFGPIALYVGDGEVQFKQVMYKDAGWKEYPVDFKSTEFRKQRLSDFYYSWGSASGDVNHDGVEDVISGPYYYLGPDYRKHREIFPAVTTNPSDAYTTDVWMGFSADFTGDGWVDSLTANFSTGPEHGVWLYENPRGESRRWDKYQVVDDTQSEIAQLSDVDGDGAPDLVYMAAGTVRWAHPDLKNPHKPWQVHIISEAGLGTAHGIGSGDINGDGRMDIVNAFGWWEHPAQDEGKPWPYHQAAFSRYNRSAPGGAIMTVYDVNGDGLKDIVTVIQAHAYGIAWYEQKRDGGEIKFIEHIIQDDPDHPGPGGVIFSQAHASTMGDVDGDGVPDFIVAKRYWTHRDNYYDADPYGEAVLYWYKTVRDKNAPGGARFEPHQIDNHSGGGSDLLAVDMNRDGKLDIVTSTRFGTFIFWNQMGKGNAVTKKK